MAENTGLMKNKKEEDVWDTVGDPMQLGTTSEEDAQAEEGVSVPEFAGMVNEARKGIMGGSLIGQSEMVKFGDDVIDWVKGQDAEQDAPFTQFVDKTVGQTGRDIVGDSEIAKTASSLIGENLAVTDLAAPVLTAFKRLDIIGDAARINKDAYEQALKLKAEGKTTDEIFEATGVFTSPADSKLRLELDDSQATIKVPVTDKATAYEGQRGYRMTGISSEIFHNIEGLTLGDILDYPDLFKAYPKAADIPVANVPAFSDPSLLGRFAEPSELNPAGRMEIKAYRPNSSNSGLPREDRLELAKDEFMSTILHETQHYVQYADELSKGGSASSLFPKGFSELQKEVNDDLKMYRERMQDAEVNSFTIDNFLLKGDNKATRYELEELQKLQEYLPEDAILEYRTLLESQKKINALDLKMYQMYQRMGGEIESRLVESRLGMSAADRASQRPTYMQDSEAKLGPLTDEEKKYFKIDSQIATDELRKEVGMPSREGLRDDSTIKRTGEFLPDRPTTVGLDEIELDFGSPKPWDAESSGLMSSSEVRPDAAAEDQIFGTSKLSSRTDDVMEGADPYEAAETTPEEIQAWKDANKVDNRFAQIPEVKSLAEQLRKGDISPEEFRAKAFEVSKPTIFTEIPKMPSLKGLLQGLSKDKPAKGIIGLNKSLEDGTRVATRLDIPAYNQYDKWIVSVHAQGGTSGSSVGYAQTAKLNNVEFLTKPQQALDIASEKATTNKKTGEVRTSAKSPFARMEGDWVNHDVKDLLSEANQYLNDPEWIQVGMNPYRASYFYDKETMEPLVEAEELIQIGPLVLARGVKKTTPDDPRFAAKNEKGEAITFSEGGLMSENKPQGSYNQAGITSFEMIPAFVTGTDEDVTDAALISRQYASEQGYDDQDRVEDTMRHVLLGGLVYGDPEGDRNLGNMAASELIDWREGDAPEDKNDLANNQYGRKLRELFPDREEFIQMVKILADGMYEGEEIPDIEGYTPKLSYGNSGMPTEPEM